MERILSVDEMRNADKYTIESLGVAEKTLIERAGLSIATEIKKRFPGGRVLVCVGKGNNGEDGKIVAKALSNVHGFTVALLNVYNGIFKMFEQKFDIIVDCIFGTGLNRNVEGYYKTAIEKINNSGAYIVSCDIPSGINGDTGEVMGVAVKANLTIAIQEYKLGHFFGKGLDYTGELISKDIGISIWGEDYAERLNNYDANKFFPKRERNVNKGSFGKATIIGGSKNYSGSVLLSLNALSALKLGAGYSNLAIPESLFSSYLGLNPECTMSFIKDIDGNMVFDKENIDKLFKYNCIAVGMGMGTSEETYKIISYIVKNYTGRLIVDADGLNSLAKFGLNILKEKSCDIVLTPHIGEFARLINKEKEEVIANSIKLAKDFAKEYGVVLALKSATSIITNGERVIINTTGTNALSKAGSGDTLSGIIAGILTLKEGVLESVACGCYLFGRAAEIATKKENEYTVTASDVVRYFPDAINSFER